MGSQQSVMVANAFPQDIWVRVRSEKITEYFEAASSSGQGQLSTAGQINFNAAAKREGKTTYETLINAGFSKMTRQTVSTFRPPSNHTKTVYVTVLYYDAEGNERYAAQDTPHAESHAVIVTATGGIVDAKDRSSPWIDLNNRNHEQDPCSVCSAISSVCSICLVESRLAEIQYSIGVVQDCKLAKSLVHTIENVRQNDVAKKQIEAQEMIREIEKLAKLYWALETKTKRAVGNVKVYGVTLKEAAEDYLEDGILTDFWRELSNITEAKQNFQLTNQEHEVIKGEVTKIQEKARSKSATFEERALTAQVYRDGEGTVMSILTIPMIGQAVAGIIAAWTGGAAAVELCEESEITDNIPVKVVAGVASGTVCAVGAVAGSIIMLPAAPYFWYKSIVSNIDAKNYGILKEQFGNIALQMGMVEAHLGNITSALHDIEQHLEYSQRAEERAFSALNQQKRVRMIQRVVEKAEQLMQACEYYFSIVDDDGMNRALST